MSNKPPQVENLRAMLALHEKRSQVQQQLDAIDAQLATLQQNLTSGSYAPSRAPVARATAPAPVTRKRGGGRRKSTRRGQLRDKIFAALESAGKSGVTVRGLADSLGVPTANIYAWFHAAIKRYSQIKKLDGAHYRLEGSSPLTVPAKTAAPAKRSKPAAKAGAAKPKAKGKKGGRGELKSRILDTLAKAGHGGMTVKDLSQKVGANYKNVQVWFATTGKKVQGLKKIAPAKYRYS